MQYQLERPQQRCQYAKIQGQEGKRLCRAIFAVMIKYAQYTIKFEECLSEVELAAGTLALDLSEEERLRELAVAMADV